MSFMVLGLPVGIFLFASLPEAPLKILLGIFMVGVAASGLAKFYLPVKSRLDADTKAGKIIMNVILLLGGMIHGAFASGGPFLVVYATRKLTDKGNFRATLSAVWLTLNSIMMGVNLFHGSYPREVFVIMGTMVPFLIAGMVIGNIAHKRIDGTTFTKMVYSVLLVSGFFMFS
jgi:hypothetical protein